jgi:hypothetical protein
LARTWRSACFTLLFGIQGEPIGSLPDEGCRRTEMRFVLAVPGSQESTRQSAEPTKPTQLLAQFTRVCIEFVGSPPHLRGDPLKFSYIRSDHGHGDDARR